MDAMDGARDLLDKTEGPTSINPLVSPLIEATPLPAHPDYGLSGSTDNEYSESTTRSKSSELNQREAHRQMPVMPGMPGMPGLQMEQGDLSRGTSEDDFSSFFSSAIQLSSNSFTSDTSMSNSSSTRSPIIGGVAMGGGGGGGGGYHNAAAAKQAASALCAPSHDSYFPEGSGRGSGSGNLYGGADRDKYEHGHHDQNAQGQYNQADRFPNVSSPMLSTNTPSLPSPLSQHQHRTLPSASAPGTPSRALQMQEMQRIHQMQQAQMQMRHPLRGPSNSAPCTPVNAFRAMQHERQKWGDAPLLNTNTDGFGGGGGYGGGRQFQYEQGHSQQGQQGQQGQGRNAYNDSMQSQQHYQQQQQQQRLMQQKWQMQQQQYEPHGGGGGYMGRGAFGPAGSGSGSEWQQQYNRGVGTQQQQPYSSPPPLPETGAELGLSLGLVGPSMLYRVRFKHETQSFALSPSCTAQVGIGSFVLVEGDRGEDIGVVEEVLPLQVLVDQRIARDAQRLVQFQQLQQQMPHMQHMQMPQFEDGMGNGLNLRRVLRLATEQETSLLAEKSHSEHLAISVCNEAACSFFLPICVLDVEYQFDRRKLTVYYDSSARINFRDFVRHLYGSYHARIWMKKVPQLIFMRQRERDANNDAFLSLQTGISMGTQMSAGPTDVA